MIVFADLHLREETERTVFEQVLPGILAAARANDHEIAFLGDWWHVRYRVPVNLQNQVSAWIRECQEYGVKIRIIPGNHDQINIDGENALEVFSHFGPDVRVYTQPTEDMFGLWIPYRKRREDIQEALLKGSINVGQWPVLWMHHGIQGAWMNDRVADTEGLPKEWFSKYLVFCGHYHKRQSVSETIHYIGSPYQTTADESGQVKGYGIWNPETQVMQYMDCHWGKRYHRLRVEPGQSLDLSQVGQGDEVRVTAAPGVDLGVLTKALDAVSGSVVVMPEVEVPQARLQVGPGASLGEYAYEYAKRHTLECNDGKSLERLMQVYQELTQGGDK